MVKVSQTFSSFRGTEIHTVRLWDHETATDHGHHAGSACYQFPVHVYGSGAVELAGCLLTYASRIASSGIGIEEMRRMIKDRLDDLGA